MVLVAIVHVMRGLRNTGIVKPIPQSPSRRPSLRLSLVMTTRSPLQALQVPASCGRMMAAVGAHQREQQPI